MPTVYRAFGRGWATGEDAATERGLAAGRQPELLCRERLEQELRRSEWVVDEGQRAAGAGPGDVAETALLLESPFRIGGFGHGATAREAAGVEADHGDVVEFETLRAVSR